MKWPRTRRDWRWFLVGFGSIFDLDGRRTLQALRDLQEEDEGPTWLWPVATEPVGYGCKHVVMVVGAGTTLSSPSAWCGCQMEPVYAA